MNIKEISFAILWGNPPRLRVGGPVNTVEVTALDMLAHTEWSLAVTRQLFKAELEAAKLSTDSKN